MVQQTPEIKSCVTMHVNIWMAGDYDEARKILNNYCFKNGSCFYISKGQYIYSAGEEKGFCVSIINYPRFPKPPEDLSKVALEVANLLRENLNQDSFIIEDNFSCEGTKFYSWRHLRGK